MNTHFRSLTKVLALFLLTSLVLIGCTAFDNASDTTALPSASSQTEDSSADICTVTEPESLTPPEDTAVQDPPAPGYYFANEDRSILASAWWADQEEYHLSASSGGVKVGWFRPAGAALEITGQRTDAEAPPLEASVPCCYPTQFQATGLIFPTEGCWEVTAKAADSELFFTVWVAP